MDDFNFKSVSNQFGVIFCCCFSCNIDYFIANFKTNDYIGEEKITAKVRINLMFNFLHSSQRLEVTKMSLSE